ncbi:MAG: ABC transporter ATP-binding protein, partial [bacterium]
RALIREPAVVLADEPTGNLDTKTGDALLELFDRCHKQGQTIVLVTHDPSAAAQADRIVFLGDGQVIDEMASPSTDRVIDRLLHLEA